jgi:phage terminase small subunit
VLQRGRKGSLAIGFAGPIRVNRPAPPAHLSEAAKDEWRAVVGRMPADWFPRETHSMLVAFCCHVVSFNEVQAKIDLMEAGSLDVPNALAMETYEALTALRERETRQIANLATKLRLTPQSRYDLMKAGRSTRNEIPEGPKPWEEGSKPLQNGDDAEGTA